MLEHVLMAYTEVPAGLYVGAPVLDDKQQGLESVCSWLSCAAQAHASAANLQDWLYDEGEDESKTVYVNKLKELEALGEPVLARAREAGTRPRATAALMTTANRMIQIASANDAKHAHISQEDKEKAGRLHHQLAVSSCGTCSVRLRFAHNVSHPCCLQAFQQ